MIFQQTPRLAGTAAMALTIAACGGGGGGGNFVSVPPAPPPTPVPSPTPFFPKIFPAVTTNTVFAALGYESFLAAGSSDAQLKSGLSVSYDAAAGSYIIDLISADPGPFKATTEETSYWRGYVENQALVVPSVDVRKPADAGFLFTTFGDYYQYEWAPVDFFTGVFAFGLPTLPAGVPTTGSATYSALLAGKTMDWSHDVEGTATLQFNFAAGTLAGSLSPILIGGMNPTALGRYDFVNTIYSVGSTTFAGGLKHETANLTGAFNGQFTGPQAQELMARWTAQYADPLGGGTKDMFGVLVGKRP